MMAAGMTPDHRPDMAGIVVVPYGQTPIRLATHPDVTDEALRTRIREGKYEVHEGKAIAGILAEGDVVVELGAGLGLISTIAYRTRLPAAIHCFEADPRLPDLIRETHRLNGVAGVHLTVAAVTADPAALAAGTIGLGLRSAFWANSVVAKAGHKPPRTVQVPAISLASIVAELRPTVIVCDIEGAEAGLFDMVDLSGVRHVLVELHPGLTGLAGVRSVFDALHAAGLVYDSDLSRGAVPGFTRISAATEPRR